MSAGPEYLVTPTPHAYPCATFRCPNRAVRVRINRWDNLGESHVGFYGECAIHGVSA